MSVNVTFKKADRFVVGQFRKVMSFTLTPEGICKKDQLPTDNSEGVQHKPQVRMPKTLFNCANASHKIV